MSKAKRGKSGSSSEVGRWETELTQILYAENDWNPMIIFLLPNIAADNDVVSVLSDTIKTGLRKLYSIVDYDQLLLEVKEITSQNKGGKGKGNNSGSKPQFSEICDHVKNILDQGENIPVTILAKLIKFKLLMVKSKDLDRRENDKKESSSSSRSKLYGSRSQTRGSPRSKSQSPGKGKKGSKKEEKASSPKKETKLKKRGEDSDVFTTIDDEPDGPNDPHCYIILTGFSDASLLSSLIDIKIIPNAIIKLNTHYYSKIEKEQSKAIAILTEKETYNEDEYNVRLQKTEKQQELQSNLQSFWENSELLTKNAPTHHPLQNIAKFDVVVKEECLPEQLLDSASQEIKTEFGAWLFDKVADVCYDMLDYLEQYKRYIENLKIIDVSAVEKKQIDNKSSLSQDGPYVPAESSSGTVFSISSDESVKPPISDLRYYDKLMSSIPVESESVPLILHCLLEQVVAVTDGPNPMDRQPSSEVDEMASLLGDYLDKKFVRFGIDEDKKIWECKNHQSTTPKIVYHGDERRSRQFNMATTEQFDGHKIENEMRAFHPYSNFVKYLQPSEEEWTESCVRRLQLYNFCKKNNPITEEKFERAMRQYIFESLPLELAMDCGIDGVDEQLEKIASRWDDPYHVVQDTISEVEQMEKNQSDESVETFSLRQLDNYNWLERFEQSILFQVLDNGSDLRPYLDTYYNRGNNTLLVVLHNPSNDQLHNNFKWESWLHSNVGFRNYLEHVAFEVQDWMMEQLRLEEEQKANQTPQESQSPSPALQPVKERSRWGMKTRAEIAAENAGTEGEKRKKSAKSRSTSPKKNASKSPDKKKSEIKTRKPSAKKSRQGTATKRPNSNKSNVSFSDDCGKVVASPSRTYAFTGYNLGDKLLHLAIDHSYLFPENGALIKIEKTAFVDRDTCVQVTLMYKGHRFSLNFVNPIDRNDVEKDENADSGDSLTTDVKITTTHEKNGGEEEACEDLLPTIGVPPSFCSYSSMTGSFSDGLMISCSTTVINEESENQQKLNKILSAISKEPSDIPPIPPITSNATAVPRSAKGKKGKKEDETKQQEETERLQREADVAKKISERQNKILQALKKEATTKNLYATYPNGMHLSFKHSVLVEDFQDLDSSKKIFVLKQQQFSNYREKMTLENCDVVKELYRFVTDEGMVIKFNSDDTVEAFSPNGDIYHSSPILHNPFSPTTEVIRTDTEQNNSPGRPSSKKGKLQQQKASDESTTDATMVTSTDSNDGDDVVLWRVLSSDGEKWRMNEKKVWEQMDGLLISDAFCYDTNQVFQTREDGVMVLRRPDGSQIVEYLDGTRITTRQETRTCKIVNGETGEEEIRTKEAQTIIVENDLYPTTVIDALEATISVVHNNGRKIQAHKNGGYVISSGDVNQLVISSTGEAKVYPNTPGHVSNDNDDTECILKQTQKDCVSLVDHVGNKFTVHADGKYNVTKNDEEHWKHGTNELITPRYFVVYPDGSGEELLRYEDVSKYLKQAEINPTSAVIHAPVEGDVEGTAVTVIKPYQDQPETYWKSKKAEDNIIPISLRERDFKTLPAREEKKPGPKFGTRLELNSKQITKLSPPSCPDILEIRHLINYKELSSDVRCEIIEGINKYGEYVQKQLEEIDRLKGKDERSMEEKVAAEKIKEKFVQKSEVCTVNELVTNASNQAAEEILAEQYIDSITPAPPPPPRVAQPERARSEWEKDKLELEELEHTKSMIRNQNFPPYFQTKQGQSFLYKSGILPDMNDLTEKLAEETKHPIRTSSSVDSLSSENHEDKSLGIVDFEKNLVASSTPHVDDSSFCVGMTSSVSMKYDMSNNSISPFVSGIDPSSSFGVGRPLNPTPHKAIVSNLSFLNMSDEQKLERIDETMGDTVSSVGSKSVNYDVNGSPRKDYVKTPSILGSRPNAVPNEKFADVEEPVRRKVKTASVLGAVDPDLTSKMRGFILFPDLLDLGVLREGHTYNHQVVLKNVGVDACRFKIKQPPPSTGLKIVYKPGLVAAGMEAKVDVEIFAVAVGVEGASGVGKISHHIEIVTETDLIYLPVIATIITQHEFENPSAETPRGGPSKGTTIVENRPNSRETLTRPRKN